MRRTAAAAALVLAACASAPQRAPEIEPPRPIDLTKPLDPAPRLALVLGGGSVRGFAHVGVIRALEGAKIRPDLVVGTSAGAVAGAYYAAGFGAAELARNVPSAGWRDIADFDYTFIEVLRGETRFGLVRGEALEAIVNRDLDGKRFEMLPIPFVAVAADLQTGALAAFARGDVGRAVRASSSIPVVFRPVRIAGRDYVDGGVVSPLPVSVARSLGAQVVVAVDVGYPPRETNLANPFNLFAQTFQIMAQQLSRCEAAAADVVVRPELGASDQIDWSSRERLAAAGEAAGRAAIGAIRAALREAGPGASRVEPPEQGTCPIAAGHAHRGPAGAGPAVERMRPDPVAGEGDPAQ